MADTLITNYLTSYEQIQSNHEKYADRFSDANAEIVNSDTFLSLLVAEMTNQDPLEPTSNTEFVSQMAQFTQLSYAQDSSTYAKANYAASLVGKTATATKMDGAQQVTKTGVVESVTKSGKTYIVNIGGESFDISKVTGVKETAKDDNAGSVDSIVSTGNNLGDMISRASMMIGMHATVNATTETGAVVDAGTIDAIQVKNGEIYIVIGDISYKLSDTVEVKYPEYNYEQPEQDAETGTEAVEGVTDTATDAEDITVEEGLTAPENTYTEEEQAVSDAIDEMVEEMLEELKADKESDEDLLDLEDLEEIEDLRFSLDVAEGGGII